MQSVQVGYGEGFEQWDGVNGRGLVNDLLGHIFPNADNDPWQRAYRFSIIRIFKHLREPRTVGDLMVAYFNTMYLPSVLTESERTSGFGDLVANVTKELQSYINRNGLDVGIARDLLVEERPDYFTEDRSYIKPVSRAILHLSTNDEIRFSSIMDKTFYTLYLVDNDKPLNPDFIYLPKKLIVTCLEGQLEIVNPTVIYAPVNAHSSHVIISVNDKSKDCKLFNRKGEAEYLGHGSGDWQDQNVRLAHGMAFALARDLLSYFMGFPSTYASWKQPSASSGTGS